MALIPFVKMQNATGRYAIFQVPGHRGNIYVDTKLFPGGPGTAPTGLEIAGLVDAVEGGEVVSADAQAKAQAKAAAAEAKEERAAKATGVVPEGSQPEL